MRHPRIDGRPPGHNAAIPGLESARLVLKAFLGADSMSVCAWPMSDRLAFEPRRAGRIPPHAWLRSSGRNSRDRGRTPEHRPPKVLLFANPMGSDNDVIRRTRPEVLSVAERYFSELSKG